MYTYFDLNIKDHELFNTLNGFKDFHEIIAYNLFGSKTNGVHGYLNLHFDISKYLALQLESISRILTIGNIGDSFTLLRKYEDLTLISIYLCLIEQNEFYKDRKIEGWPWIIDQLNNWASNNMNFKMKSFEKINKEIRESGLQEIMHILESKIDYLKLRNNTGNRYTHFNQFKTVFSLIELDNNTISNILSHFRYTLTHNFIRYFSLLAIVREDYFRSSDYIDYLDAGEKPEEEALFWVLPFANELLNKVIYQNRPDVAKYIVENSQMHWELQNILKD